MTLSLLVPSVALAQDETDDPNATPSPFCAVLTADEASTALGVTLTVGSGSQTDCSYDSDFETSDVSLSVYRDDGPITSDQFQSYYPDGITTTVAGHDAYYDAESAVLFVDEGVNDQLFVLQVFGSMPDGVDVQTALTTLAESGLPRLAAIPLPPEPTIEPEPSYLGDAELEALMPTEIGGTEVDITSMSSQDLISGFDPDDPDAQAALQSLKDALASMGTSVDALSTVDGTFATEDSFGYIQAIRLAGQDISSLTDDLLPLVLTDLLDPRSTPAVIAGKAVTLITDGPAESPGADPSASPDPYAVPPSSVYAYAHGDVLWLVSADEPALTEVFQKLP